MLQIEAKAQEERKLQSVYFGEFWSVSAKA